MTERPTLIRLGGEAFAHPYLEPFIVDADDVRPHPDNPNNGDVEALIESLRTVGCYRVIGVQRSTGFVLMGNTLYAGLLELGATRLPAGMLDVDDEAALRMLLGDNKIARRARMDHGIEYDLLKRLEPTGLSLLATGYEPIDMERLAKSQQVRVNPPAPVRVGHQSYRCPDCGHEWSGSPRPSDDEEV